MKLSLNTVLYLPGHIVSEIVKPKLVVLAVGDVCSVGFPSFARHKLGHKAIGIVPLDQEGGIVLDHPNRQPQKEIDRPNPQGIPSGQIVVNRNKMSPLAAQGIEVEGHRGHQSLSLSRLHLGNFSLMKHYASHNLNIVRLQANGSPGHLFNQSKGLKEKVVFRLAIHNPLFQLFALLLKLLIRERTHL